MALSPGMMARGAWRSVMQLIESGYDFDIVDAHYFYPDGVAAAVLAERLGKPLVITARGSDINLFPQFRAARGQILWAADRAAHIVTVSAALKQRLVELAVPREKITVIRNGVDLEIFTPQDRLACRRALALHGPSLLMVGSLIPLKGHRLVIEALADLPEWSLVVAGEGPERAALERKVERLGLGQRVRFLGTVPHEALPQLYTAADLLILASSQEGIANVLFEAMTCGTPVVTTAAGGCPEVVTSSDAGIVVPERSPQALREAILDLWVKRPDRSRTRHHAERFDWAETARKQAAVLHAARDPQCSLTSMPHHHPSGCLLAGPICMQKTAD
jgi:glycosyltransferase involved in cell wall biosynthesis